MSHRSFIDLGFTMQALPDGAPASEDTQGPVPLVTFRFTWKEANLGAFLEGSGLFVPLGGGDEVTFLDADIGVRYSFADGIDAVCGLRYFQIGADLDDSFGDSEAGTDTEMELLGWFVGGLFSF